MIIINHHYHRNELKLASYGCINWSPGQTLRPGGEQRLSSSMFDLSSPQDNMQVRLFSI